MKVIQVQDLQAQDIQSISEHQLLFHGQLFQLGPKISKKLEKAVLEYCQISCKSGQACLLQDDGSHWVVWKRVKKSPERALPPSPATNTAQPRTLSPQFINRCKQELAICIGPIADLVFEQTLSSLNTDILKPQEFVAALSRNIPSSALASRFHDHCQPASEAEMVASRVRSMKHSTQTGDYLSRNKRVHSPVSI